MNQDDMFYKLKCQDTNVLIVIQPFQWDNWEHESEFSVVLSLIGYAPSTRFHLKFWVYMSTNATNSLHIPNLNLLLINTSKAIF